MKMTTTAVPAVRIIRTLIVMLAGIGVAHAQTAPRGANPPAPRRAAAARVERAAANAPAASESAAASTAAGNVVARVNGAELTAEDVRAYLSGLGGPQQAAMVQDPALLSQAVRLLLANRLVQREIAAKKWDQQPAIVAQLNRVRENAEVELYLQSVSMPPANFPSDDDLQKVYDANREAFLVPRQFQLQQIFVALPAGGNEADAKKHLDEIQRKLKAPGADFAAIAQSDNDAKGGGNLGWIAENQIRPEIRAQVLGLAKNAVSEPIRLDDGWHIMKLIDTKASYTATLADVRPQLVQRLRAEKAAELRRAYIAELLKKNPPEVNELALSSLIEKPKQ
ncbi:MAG TPA: peptidylprolyl isomerase [Bradyrhizobium sp.]|nr:peptidylprolyl isomerase [Bradyrhizobium sp.]